MGAMNNENNPQSIQMALGTVSADGVVLAGYIPAKAKLKSVKIYSAAGLAQSDTDYLVCQLKVGSTVKASYSSQLTGGNGAIAAGVTSMVIADAALAQDSKLELDLDETGNISLDMHVVVEFYPL